MTDLNVSLNDCREQFEEWAYPTYDFTLHKSGTYQDDHTRAVWRAWKAAWELQDARIKGAMA